MSRLFYHVMQDNAGNLLFDVSGTMRLAGTGTAATIYGDEALTVPIANPMTNHPSFGSFKCFLGVGDYDFYMAKSGYTFETLTGVQGHGTMAQQDASNVAIGNATITTLGVGAGPEAEKALRVSGATHLQGDLDVTLTSTLTGRVGIGRTPDPSNTLVVSGPTLLQGALATEGGLTVQTTASHGLAATNARLAVGVVRASHYGAIFQPDADSGATVPVLFRNAAGTQVGFIETSATTTTYNTGSDARLKHDIDDLTGELAIIQALRPVRFKWNADDSDGVGFLAQEVQAVIPDGVTVGKADAVDDAGQVVPQMIDYSKLVPWLVGACKSLIERVEALQARVEVLEDAAGV